MEAYHHQLLTPTGCSHVLSVRLTRLNDSHSVGGTVISHLITARDSLVQVWEVRELVKDGTASASLHHILTRRLHGVVTSLSRVRTLASKIDGADRVLVTFLDAKMSLMEWTSANHELLPISLHTFEKLPQVVDGRAKNATDPSSRLAVMLLPSNTGGDGTLVILPFFQEEIDLESLGVDTDAWETDGMASLPYAPSHLLPLASLTSSLTHFQISTKSSTIVNAPTGNSPPSIRNVVDMVFLPGFNEPTLALLYSPEPTWAGRLENVSSNCLVSLVTLASGPTKTDGSSSHSTSTTAVVIATSPPLPHSCLAIYPCPPDLGGTLIVTANGLLHLEQGGKLIGVASNAWFSKEWLGTGGGNKDEPTVREALEGVQIVFVENEKALLFCKSGAILELTMSRSGRSISGMRLDKIGKGVPASCVERIRGSVGRFGEQGYAFVGSEVGESSLISWELRNTVSLLPAPVALAVDSMEVDDDDDLYGPSGKTITPLQTSSEIFVVSGVKGLVLRVCDTIASYGGIRNMVMGLVGDECPPDLVACTGGGPTAGFTIVHRTICPRKRRELNAESVSTRGIWSFSVGSGDSVLITSDSASSRIKLQSADGEIREDKTEDCTIAAGSIFNGSYTVRVTNSQIFLLDSTLSSVKQFPFRSDLNAVRAIISDPYVLVIGLETSQLFIPDGSSQTLVERTLPSDFENLASLSLFRDSGLIVPLLDSKRRGSIALPRNTVAIIDDDDDDDLYTSAPRRALASDMEHLSTSIILPSLALGATSSGGNHAWSWIPTVNSVGELKISLLPNLEEVFSASAIALFPDVIEDGSDGLIDEDVDPDDITIDRIMCLNIGHSIARPHLLILLTNGSLAIYEAFPSTSAPTALSRKMTLGVRFVKVVTRRLSVPIVRRGKIVEDLPPPVREVIPFSNIASYSGAFITGEDPIWLIATDHGPARLLDHSEKFVYGFSAAGVYGLDDYLVQSKSSFSVASFPKKVCFDRELPYLRVPRDRRYGSVTFDIDSSLYVVGALFETTFVSYDDEGEPLFVNDSPEFLEPTNYRSALELLVPGTWEAYTGYEFRPNEFVSTIKSVRLASSSTASGRKEFIAVGTTVYRGEDLSARGGIYIFEVVKLVPLPETPDYNHALKLLFFEDTKSVVGNVCDIDGYLVMSMGQKLYVRAFEQDEVLLAVGFLDVGVHVTSLQSMKNFLLIGDALQSVTLVAFQDDPYRLVLLGRDYRLGRTSSANFLVNDSRVSFITGDMDGVLRIFEYDPTNIASHAGQRLLCRTEYNAGAEGSATLLYAKYTTGSDEVKQNGILYGGVDGSLYTLVPVRDLVFKRLQLLQAQLARHIQHFGGLNPRGHRIVKNDSVSRAITKGILDGELLSFFESLPLDRQLALTSTINTDPDTVLLNLRNLNQW